MTRAVALVAALFVLAAPVLGQAAPVTLNLSGQLSHALSGDLPAGSYPFPLLLGGSFDGSVSLDPAAPATSFAGGVARFGYLSVEINIRDSTNAIVHTITASDASQLTVVDGGFALLLGHSFGPDAIGVPEDLRIMFDAPSVTASSALPSIAQVVGGTFSSGFSEIDGSDPFTSWDLSVASAQITASEDSALSLGPAHLWIGLTNGDDQGTRFDLLVEMLQNGTPVASELMRCIAGVKRNPAHAKEVVVAFDPSALSIAPSDVLALRVSTRIGTNPNGTRCAGHASARGLRLYYDSVYQPARVGLTVSPDPSEDLFLESDGGPCRNADSTGVTTRTLNAMAPTATAPKCKDSAAVNFARGNPFREIGTWSLR